MEQLILSVIEKVRKMYKYTPTVKDIVAQSPNIKLHVDKNYKLTIDSINFYYYDILCVTSHCIVYKPEHGSDYKLISYNGFEELLKL